MKLTSGKIQKAQRIVIYGPEGIGKTTLANQFPAPVFVDIEDSTSWMNVNRLTCNSWRDILDAIKFLKTEKHAFKTIVFDTADWAERFCVQHICGNASKTSIEDFGYGKGYTYLTEEFAKMLTSLVPLIDAGMNVIFVAHCTVKKIEQPDETGSYDHYEFKCTRQTSPLLKEWAEAVLFVNYHVIVRQNDNKRSKAIGGRKRIIHTQHTAAYDAKNRSDLPDQIPFELPFDFKLIAGILGEQLPESADTPSNSEAVPAETQEPPPAEEPTTLVKLSDALEGITGDANAWLLDKGWIKEKQTFRNLPEKKMTEILERLQNFKQAVKSWKAQQGQQEEK